MSEEIKKEADKLIILFDDHHDYNPSHKVILRAINCVIQILNNLNEFTDTHTRYSKIKKELESRL